MNDILAEIVEYLEDARQYENYVVGLCPFHDDSRPSFFVYPDTYNCKSCGAFGRTSKLLEKLSKMPAKPHKQSYSYNPFTAWMKKYDKLGTVLKTAYENNKQHPSIYLRDRGIDAATQILLSIGQMENWITFPIRNADGKIEGAVARKGENNLSKSKYVIPANQSPNLIYVPSWQRIIDAKVIFLTFGIIDSISLYLCGVASMSTTTGKQLDPTALKQINKHIYIIPDLGEEQDGHKLASQLGWRGRCLNVNYPEGCKDVNDVYNLDNAHLLTTLEKYK